MSNNQGLIGWPQVAGAGKRFAALKGSEGIDYPDAYLTRNLEGCEANSVNWFPYCFARFDKTTDGAAHARYLRSLLPRVPDWVALDVEPVFVNGVEQRQPADLSAPALAFFGWWENAGVPADRCYLYTDVDYLTHRGLGKLQAGGYRLWLASPGVPHPAAVNGWKASIVQYDWKGKVAGVAGDCDLNRIAAA